MRLQHVHISEYKNLKNFELNFEESNFLDIFVGKNGTGKSNLFEALIEIFRHLDDADDTHIDFDYKLTYEIGTKTTKVIWKNSKLSVNGNEQNTLGTAPKPDNILVYYSGHNETVTSLIKKYETSFRKNIKSADASENRYFIGIGPEYKELLLTTILLQPETSICRKYICDRLGIQAAAPDFKITLKRPYYARNKTQFDVLNNDAETQFWKAEGSTKDFLNLLQTCASIQSEKGPIRTQGYQANDDQYITYINCEKLRTAFAGSDPHELFNAFDKLRLLEMLDGISIELALVSGQSAYTSYFSDGQFQSVYIYAITELFKTRHCLTLLDEPDCFLHPEWQHKFLDQVFEISEDAAQTNHTLLSSHSAVTLIPHKDKKVRFFELQDNKPHCFPLPKRVAIKKLSSDLIKYSEQEQILSIINAIQIENKPVLFTEGSTDPIIIKEAWNKLYDDDIPFIPFYAFSCSFINNLLTDSKIHTEMGGLPIFGLFDLDQAYNQWKGLNGDVISDDPFKGMTKKWASGNSYALVVPVPDNEDIKKQAIKDEATKETFEGDSFCEIEHLFYGHQATKDYFKTEPCAGGERIAFISDSRKTEFAKEVIPLLDKEAFKVLVPLFDFIKSKCPATV